MSYTDDDYLPSPCELDVPQEIELTSAPLRCAAHHMGKWCDNESKVHQFLFLPLSRLSRGMTAKILLEFLSLPEFTKT